MSINNQRNRFAIITHDTGNPQLRAIAGEELVHEIYDDLRLFYDLHNPRVDVDYYAVDDDLVNDPKAPMFDDLVPIAPYDEYDYLMELI